MFFYYSKSKENKFLQNEIKLADAIIFENIISI